MLANLLVPRDLKGLSKQQLKDLKEGRRSPSHLVDKYTGMLFPRKEKPHWVKHSGIHKTWDEINGIGVESGKGSEGWEPDGCLSQKMAGSEPAKNITLSASPPSSITFKSTCFSSTLIMDGQQVNSPQTDIRSQKKEFPIQFRIRYRGHLYNRFL